MSPEQHLQALAAQRAAGVKLEVAAVCLLGAPNRAALSSAAARGGLGVAGA